MDDSNQTDSTSLLSFSLFSGGPFYRLQKKLGIIRADQRRPGVSLLYVILVIWLPMVVLAAVQGLALGTTRLESFLLDFVVNVRFLVTVPVFLITEAFCESRLLLVTQQFLEAGLVKDTSRFRFEDLLRDTVRLSHSGWAETVLLVLAYLHTLVPFLYILNFPDSTWRLPFREGHPTLSMAGAWHFLVAFPLFSFLLWRWLWRLGLWWRFLWKTSNLELHLAPAHRDGAGGLGFLSESLPAFGGFVFGIAALAAGGTADFVIYEGQSLLEYKWEVIGLVAFLLVLIAGPLLLFAGSLYEAKEYAIFRYSKLAARQIQEVEGKWLSKEALQEETKSDFWAVAHFGSSMTAAREMSLIPLHKEDVFELVLIALLPFVPLLVTLIPMEEIVSLLLKVLA